jgi:hypothetical protein
MTAIRSLCTTAIHFREGLVVDQGQVGNCIDRYLAETSKNAMTAIDVSRMRRPAVADATLHFQCVQVSSGDGDVLVFEGKPLKVALIFSVSARLEDVSLGLALMSAENVFVFECRSSQHYGPITRLDPGTYGIECVIDPNLLRPGFYMLSVGARCDNKYLDYLPNAITFELHSNQPVESL